MPTLLHHTSHTQHPSLRKVKTIKSRDNTTIYYEVTPSQNKHMLLFIHGIGGDLTAWNPERHMLAALGYGTIAVDLRGHGFSGRPQTEDGYDIAYFIDDIVGVLQAEDAKHAILIGHSFGGMLAATIAAKYHIWCKALILVDTNYKAVSYGAFLASHKIIDSLVLFIANHTSTKHIEEKPHHQQYVGTGEYDPVRLASDLMHTSPRSYFFIWEKAMHYTITRLLKDIRAHILIIAGINDTVFPPQTEIAFWKKFKHASLDFVPNASHVIVLNNARDLVHEIRAFLTNLHLRS